MNLSQKEIDALRGSYSPQPSRGRVLDGLHVAYSKGSYLIWDSRQTAGYLCAASSLAILNSLLEMEAASKGSVRYLITGEPSPWDISPPSPAQDTYRGKAKIDLSDLLRGHRNDLKNIHNTS